MKQKTTLIFSRIALILFILGMVLPQTPIAQAASITTASDVMSRLKASTPSNHEIKMGLPSGVAANTGTVILTFSGGFTNVSGGTLVFGDVDIATGSTSNCTTATYTEQTVAAAPSGAGWGVTFAGQAVTLTAGSGGLGATFCLRVRIGTNTVTGGVGTHQISNGATGSSDTIAISGNGGDTGTMAVDIITDDQVVVTATVDPTITFTINDNTVGFGSLSSTAARWANGAQTGSSSDVSAHNLTVATNAASGYVLSYNGPTLTSGGNTIDVAAITDDADGTQGIEQFGLGVDVSNSSTIATGYDHNATAGQRDWTFVASTTTTIVSRITPTNTETINAYYLANIGGATEAGNYSTTITYIATGTF